jgi:hypothetical protein
LADRYGISSCFAFSPPVTLAVWKVRGLALVLRVGTL